MSALEKAKQAKAEQEKLLQDRLNQEQLERERLANSKNYFIDTIVQVTREFDGVNGIAVIRNEYNNNEWDLYKNKIRIVKVEVVYDSWEDNRGYNKSREEGYIAKIQTLPDSYAADKDCFDRCYCPSRFEDMFANTMSKFI